MNSITFEDFPRICRICMSFGELQPLLQLKTIHILHIVLPIVDVSHTNFPKNVCQHCTTGLENIQEFIEKAQNCHILLEMLGLQKNNIDIKNTDYDPQRINIVEETEAVDKLKEQYETDTFVQEDVREDDIVNYYKNLECLICGEKLLSRQSFASHMRTHRKDQIYQCCQCPQKFPYAVYLKRHTINSHGTKPFICEICQVGFTRKSSLTEHMNHHTGESPYACSHCGERFKVARLYNKHMYLFHNPNISAIPRSSRKYTEKRVHLNIECKECGKIFASRSGYANHQLKHKGIKKYLCNMCGKQFLTNSQLQIHLRHHKGEKPYSCNERGETVLNNDCSMLQKCNQEVNATVETVPCAVCTKTFNSKKKRQSHMKKEHAHLLQCEYCEKKFTFPSYLNVHLRVHNGDKPFMCSVCGKLFSQKQALNVHMRIHTGVTPFECTRCTKKYHDSSNLKRHFRRRHELINSSE